MQLIHTLAGVSEQVEALHDLKGIEDLRGIYSFSPSSTLTLKVYYTVALLQCVVQNYDQVGYNSEHKTVLLLLLCRVKST